MLEHPLARRFTAKTDASGDNRVRTAADVLGERLVRLAGYLIAVTLAPDDLRMNVADDKRLPTISGMAALALKAPPYLWTEEVRSAIGTTLQLGTDGHPRLPRHVISARVLPAPVMWWTFETGITIATFEAHGKEVAIDAMLIHDSADACESFLFGEVDEGHGVRPFIDGCRFEYGAAYPDDFVGDPRRTQLESVLSFLGFLNSPYIPKTTARFTRPERRDVMRRKAVDLGEEITFVTLRRPEPRPRKPSEENGSSVDWKHRWIVSGHYRAQWFPSEAAHHVIWIAPYLKGPEDAPLVEHAYRVAR